MRIISVDCRSGEDGIDEKANAFLDQMGFTQPPGREGTQLSISAVPRNGEYYLYRKDNKFAIVGRENRVIDFGKVEFVIPRTDPDMLIFCTAGTTMYYWHITTEKQQMVVTDVDPAILTSLS